MRVPDLYAADLREVVAALWPVFITARLHSHSIKLNYIDRILARINCQPDNLWYELAATGTIH